MCQVLDLQVRVVDEPLIIHLLCMHDDVPQRLLVLSGAAVHVALQQKPARKIPYPHVSVVKELEAQVLRSSHPVLVRFAALKRLCAAHVKQEERHHSADVRDGVCPGHGLVV